VTSRKRAPVTNFDALSNSAFVSQATVVELLSVSAATLWRRCKDDGFPPPVKIGNATRWNVGQIRKYVKGLLK
jgi:predicted DNA-binding transcriptional regulator AlpA